MQSCYDDFIAQGLICRLQLRRKRGGCGGYRQALGYDKIIYYGSLTGRCWGSTHCAITRNSGGGHSDGIVPASATRWSDVTDIPALFNGSLRLRRRCRLRRTYPMRKTCCRGFCRVGSNPQAVTVNLGAGQRTAG